MASRGEKQLAFMLEFKQALNSYLRLKLRLQEINDQAGQMSFHSYGQEERIRTEVTEIMRQYEPARTEVARRMTEATEILNEFEQKTVYTIYPAPAFGGVIRRLTIFEVVIEESLPDGLEVNYREICGIVDQTIFALERKILQNLALLRKHW